MKTKSKVLFASLLLSVTLLLATSCDVVKETPTNPDPENPISTPETTREMDPFPYGERIKAVDVGDYKIEDFLNQFREPIGNNDPKSGEDPVPLSNSNWYVSPSISTYLTRATQEDYPTIQRRINSNSIFGNRGSVRQYSEGANYVEDAVPSASFAQDSEGEATTDAPLNKQETVTPEHSKTTVQVEGVDEADIIKTDGRYLYYLSRRNGIAIVKEGELPEQVATLKPNVSEDSYPPDYQNLYISGNQLVLISNSYRSSLPGGILRGRGSEFSTVFFVYDISKPEAPVLARTVEIDGNLNTSRFFDNKIYFVTEQTYDRAKADDNVASFLPAYRDSQLGEDTYLLSPQKIHLLTQKNRFSYQYSMIGSFGLESNAPVTFGAYEGDVGAVYMNQNALYIAGNYHTYSSSGNPFTKAEKGLEYHVLPETRYSAADTYVNRFEISDSGLAYDRMGIAPGQPINQYSMDEYQGTFRIATTFQGDSWMVENGLVIFNTATMEKVGSLEGLAPGETIKSVRFTGTTGYIVTFRQVDPLFVIDLRNPAKPVVDGELKIPGFSTYLHPIGDGLVIGIGRTEGGEDDFSEGQMRRAGVAFGAKVSMFDVSNPKRPLEIHSLTLGNETAESEALSNPKSIMFDMDKRIMAFPLDYETEEGTPWNGGVVLGFGEEGFEQKAEISLDSFYGDGSRFVYIGERLYYVCEGDLVVINYGTYQIVDQIPLVFEA